MPSPSDRERAEALAPRATMAIITALPKEQVAVKAMLDGPVPYSTPGNAPGEYFLGTVPSKEGGEHVVVLARCSIGENLAAANASVLLERFPHIEGVIVTGIGGAVPDPSKSEHDVRLGDIVVSSSSGVIQYDHDKEVLKDGVVTSEPRHPPRPTSARLVVAADELQAAELEGTRPWEQFFGRASALPWTRRPEEPDVLHQVDTPSAIVERKDDPLRQPGMPRVFHGPIASGNKLLKNAVLRERLRATFGAKAAEMEASGVADAAWLQRVGYFVVRGTCDYCDEFKNDVWQGHAAMVAAAYTRALLEQTRAARPSPSNAPDDGQAPAKALSTLPRRLRERFDHALASEHVELPLSTALGELIEAETRVAIDNETAWPADRPWASLVTEALSVILDSDLMEVKLRVGETLLAISLPFVISAVRKNRIERQFHRDIDPVAFKETYQQLVSTTPSVDALLSRELPESGTNLVARWARVRLLHAQRGKWTDEVMRAACPEVLLARCLTSDPTVLCLARTVGGNLSQFDALPDKGNFRFDQQVFEVRWRLLACLLTLAEMRVLGMRLLPPDVIEHASQLPAVCSALEAQLRELAVASDENGNWVLSATCDEPALDYAITGMARQLDKELRSDRARMSDYLAQIAHRSFPTVRADVRPRLVDGEPRYTTPHVAFALSSEHARRLFMGTDLWGDPFLAYRELFQNALDACRYRVARCRHLGIPYTPLIRMYHGVSPDGQEYVECEDNGIGMDRELVASCFAVAGRRFVDTDEFRREQRVWREDGIVMHTNSQFGVGVFSYFLVADELEVETARLGVSGDMPRTRLLLHVPTASSFFRIVTLSEEEARANRQQRQLERGDTPSRLLDAGTRVRLRLQRRPTATGTEIIDPKTCVDVIREHVWFSEVAVEVRDYRGQEYRIKENALASWLEPSIDASRGNLRFWWVARVIKEPAPTTAGATPLTTFRSRSEADRPRSDAHHYGCVGRVLVDGIVTDVTTPGFILNLTSEHSPKLSLDRRKLKSNVADLVEESVSNAFGKLPEKVSWRFLSDLWYWDPRACHRASQELVAARRSWVSDSERKPYLASEAKEFDKLYFPQHSIDSSKKSFNIGDYHSSLILLWELAREAPDAIDQSPFVLEKRGVSYQLRKHLSFVPRDVWNAWSRTDLGVAEAAALECDVWRSNAFSLLAHMSWLTGTAVGLNVGKLRSLSDLFDFDLVEPALDVGAVVSDYDAWLLGHGSPETDWLEPPIRTIDVVLFCSRTNRTLQEALEGYNRTAKTLGVGFMVDPVLAENVGSLSDMERLFLWMADRGARVVPDMCNVTPERAQLLMQLVRPEFTTHRMPRGIDPTEYTGDDRVIAEALRDSTRSRHCIDLGAICEVSRALKRPISLVAEFASRVASSCGYDCAWSPLVLDAVSGFSEVDWRILEDRSLLSVSQRIIPRDRLGLLAHLGSNRYEFHRKYASGSTLYERVQELYGFMGWEPPLITVAELEAAFALDYSHFSILEKAPPSGHFTIPRLIVLSVTSGRSLNVLANDLRVLEGIGVTAPSATDTYLGISWGSLLAAGEVQEERT